VTNYQNTLEVKDNYGFAILLKIRTFTGPSTQNPSTVDSQLLDLLQTCIYSRKLTDRHIQRLGFKTKVGEALIGIDISDEFSRKSNRQFMTILELPMLV